MQLPPGVSLIPWGYFKKYLQNQPKYEGNPLEKIPAQQNQAYIICPYCGGRIEP